MPSRFAARVITGPWGHFVAGTLDIMALVGHVLRARLTGRDPW